MVLLFIPSPASSLTTNPTTGVALPGLRDEFDSLRGEFANYDCYDAAQRTQLKRQRHIDLLAFDTSVLIRRWRVPLLNGATMTNLAPFTMSQLNGNQTATSGYYETWSAPGNIASRALNVNLTTSVQNFTATLNAPLDLSTGFDGGDFISCGLPALPTQIDTAASFIDFTSNVSANFATGPTDSVALNESTIALVPGSNSEFRILRSRLGIVNLSAITAIRFRIKGTAAAGTIHLTGLRLLSKDWKYAPVDYHTVYKRIERTPALNGTGSYIAPATVQTYNFPVAQGFGPAVPPEWPFLFRSSDPAGVADPRPINGSYVARFRLGNPTTSHQMRFLFREQPLDEVLQLDLDRSSTVLTTQAKLNAAGMQPNAGEALFLQRPQSALEGSTQASLDLDTQGDLELIPDHFVASWVEVNMIWTNTARTLFMGNENAQGYTFSIDPAILTAGSYMLVIDLIDTAMRVRIYDDDDYLTEQHATPARINLDPTLLKFDSSLIDDDNTFKRRKGRVGWWAYFDNQSTDYDWLDFLRTRDLAYAEYRSHTLNAITPVAGISLTAAYTGDQQLVTSITGRSLSTIFSQAPAATVAPDNTKSASGVCYKVTTGINQALTTNQFMIDSVATFTLDFDLSYPGPSDDLMIYLLDSYDTPIELDLAVTTTAFEHHRIPLPDPDSVLPGLYTLVIAKGTNGNATWYIDNLKIRQRNVVWETRPAFDPWSDTGGAWIPFGDALNKEAAGVTFGQPSVSPQIRAKATQQTATVSQLKVVPKYSEPGRLVWPEDALLRGGTNLMPSFRTGTTGWSTLGAAPTVFATQTTWTTSGIAALRFTGTVATSGASQVVSPIVPVTVGLPYAFVYDLNIISEIPSGGTMILQVDWFAGGTATTSVSNADITGATGVVRLKNVAIPPVGTTGARVRAIAQATGAGGGVADFYIDGVMIVQSASVPPTYYENTQLLPNPVLPPTAAIIYTVASGVFTFTGYNSFGPNPITAYYWAFGDGQIGSGPVVTHTYARPGTYYPTLQVIDQFGRRGAISQMVIA